jgi:hypothetical protein
MSFFSPFQEIYKKPKKDIHHTKVEFLSSSISLS